MQLKKQTVDAIQPAVFMVFLGLCTLLMIGCGDSSGSSSGLNVNVTTTYGPVRGFEADNNTLAWRGIPYAKPPVGNLRWKPPVKPDSWTAVRDAGEDAWGDQAAQYPIYAAFGEGGMSEDCLNLNIISPKNADNLPVMVWFHGGGFTILTSNSDSYNTTNSLTTKGVVLVTVNHRLGPFGYLAHPLLTAESGYNGSGNYGQMDLIMALEWIQDNIAQFGGNPDNVTLFGQSGGGGKALSLMASPLASGLFHKVIIESGLFPMNDPEANLNGTTLAEAETKGEALFAQLGVSTLSEARAIEWEDIMTAVDALYPPIGFNHDITHYMPNVDGYYMTDIMENLIQAPMVNDVPMMVGANGADLVVTVDVAAGVADQMPDRNDNSDSNQYVYKWNYVPAGWADDGIEAYHGVELVYVFNYPTGFAAHYVAGLTGYSPFPIDDLDEDGQVTSLAPGGFDYEDIVLSAEWSDVDTNLADDVMTMWTNFAKSGNPSTTEITWTPYTNANGAYLEIGADAGMSMKNDGLEAAFRNP